MKLTSRQKLAFVLAVILVITLIILLMTSSERQPASTAPDTAAAPQAGSTTQLKGFDVMIDRGLSNDQLSDLRYALYSYGKKTNGQFKTITATNVLHTHDKEAVTLLDKLTFDLSFDSKTTLNASLSYSAGFSPVELYLYDSSGRQVYDSGVVDLSNSGAVPTTNYGD